MAIIKRSFKSLSGSWRIIFSCLTAASYARFSLPPFSIAESHACPSSSACAFGMTGGNRDMAAGEKSRRPSCSRSSGAIGWLDLYAALARSAAKSIAVFRASGPLSTARPCIHRGFCFSSTGLPCIQRGVLMVWFSECHQGQRIQRQTAAHHNRHRP